MPPPPGRLYGSKLQLKPDWGKLCKRIGESNIGGRAEVTSNRGGRGKLSGRGGLELVSEGERIPVSNEQGERSLQEEGKA